MLIVAFGGCVLFDKVAVAPWCCYMEARNYLILGLMAVFYCTVLAETAVAVAPLGVLGLAKGRQVLEATVPGSSPAILCRSNDRPIPTTGRRDMCV